MMRRLALPVLLLLGGCDAWPTIVEDRSQAPITLQYHHRDYRDWSAPLSIKAGFALPLARGHWIDDLTGIKIEEGARVYVFPERSIRRLQYACPSTGLGRRLAYAPDCYLIYTGKGRLMATAKRSGAPQEK